MIPFQGGMDAAMLPSPPPPELARFKPALAALGAAYIVVLILGISVGGLSNALNDIFVAVSALLMACRAEHCLKQCVLPFFLFATMAVLFDVLTLVTTLSQPYPGMGQFLSTSCPTNISIFLLKNSSVYLADTTVAAPAKYVITSNTKGLHPHNGCNIFWVLGNVATLLSTLLDLLGTSIGWRMFKVMRESVADDFQFGQMINPAGVPSMGLGPRGPHGAGANRGSGAEMQQQRSGFTPFSGPGQALG